MKSSKTLKMAQTAILLAIVLIMASTPLGYLRTGGLAISLLSIPVAIGAMIIGPGAGAILGAAFGLTSFYQSFTTALGTALLSVNPFFTFLVCVPTRILMGYLCGVLFRLVQKVDKTKTICYLVGGFLAAFLNTVFFMGTLMLLYWNTDVIQNINASLGGLNVLMFVVAFVGINGALEWPASSIGAGIISKALSKAIRPAVPKMEEAAHK